MNRRTLAARVLVVLAVAALAIPAAANARPAPTRLSVSHTAQYVSPNQINLEVAVTCDPGLFFTVDALVSQPQGGIFIVSSGLASGRCSGHQQKVALPVFAFFGFPFWQLGDAVASVYACTYACDNETRTIRIALS